MFIDKVKLDKQRIKDVLIAFSPIAVILALVVFITYRYVDPAPPKHLIISAGDPQGNYFAAAEEYKEAIKKEGIDLEIQDSKGAWDNLKRLEDPKSGVEVAFVQDGLGSRQKNPNLTSLGSLFYEPVWVFYRKGAHEMNRLGQLQGKHIAIGEHGGETHTMATKLLTASGVTAENSKLIEGTDEVGAAALHAGTIDAAIFIASAEEPMIVDLIKDPKIELMSMDQPKA